MQTDLTQDQLVEWMLEQTWAPAVIPLILADCPLTVIVHAPTPFEAEIMRVDMDNCTILVHPCTDGCAFRAHGIPWHMTVTPGTPTRARAALAQGAMHVTQDTPA